ncbi:MAG: hypothetical protein KA004_04900 [Verrucomicrobiales bacterium]|nr:hypothetical protein [Verrucomicrobiales bacterium]
MNILLTNESLAVRPATEPFVRDLARHLQERGHLVFVASSDPGHRERLLERDLIAVAGDLENLPIRPDIIHALHPLDAMTALTALPGVPAVYHDRGSFWQNLPPRHPRLLHHLLPSRGLLEQLRAPLEQAGATCSHFPISVATDRFTLVREPPGALRRALFINHHLLPDGDTLQAFAAVARSLDLSLDIAGIEFGCGREEAERILPAYDLVFAAGQNAADALACGCAVVVTGANGFGGMVTGENLELWHDQGFHPAHGSTPPIPFAELRSVLRAYQCGNHIALAQRLRRAATFTAAVDRLEALYAEIIQRHATAPPCHSDEEMRAISCYLRGIAPKIMFANFSHTGLMQPRISWVPSTVGPGIFPQK